MRNPVFLGIAGLAILVSASSMAQTAITYQGELLDDNGPANGTVAMEFMLYDDEAGTDLLGTDGPRPVEVNDGLFQVELDFGSVYSDPPVYLQIVVDDTPLLELQKLTPAPAAVSVPWSGVTGAPGFWRLGGNTGTDPSQDFFGTTDFTPIEFRVNGRRALRIEPVADLDEAHNIVAGHESNRVDTGVVGATIAGGGAEFSTTINDVDTFNSVISNYGTIGGGFGNTAARLSTVGGGNLNAASSIYATIGGGTENLANDTSATVGGGQNNKAAGFGATVGGGIGNLAGIDSGAAADNGATVGGGEDNTAGAIHATVPGGSSNCAGGAVSFAAGKNAKVRPPSDPNDESSCADLPSYPDNTRGDEGTFVWADSSSTDFISTGSNQFLVRAAGGVGLNTNAPDAPLHLAGENNWNLTNTEGDFKIGNDTHRFKVGVSLDGGGAGNVRLHAQGGTHNLILGSNETDVVKVNYAEGLDPMIGDTFSLGSSGARWTSVWAADGTINTSDARLKRDVAPLDGALDALLALRPVSYRWKERPDAGKRLGLIAQEVRTVLPEVVEGAEANDVLGIRYAELMPVVIAAMQEQQARLRQLSAENARLRDLAERNAEVADRNAQLEARMTALEAVLFEQRRVAERQ